MSKAFNINNIWLCVPIEQKSDNTEEPMSKKTLSMILRFLLYLFCKNINFCKKQKQNNKIPEIQHSQKPYQEITNSAIGIKKTNSENHL